MFMLVSGMPKYSITLMSSFVVDDLQLVAHVCSRYSTSKLLCRPNYTPKNKLVHQ